MIYYMYSSFVERLGCVMKFVSTLRPLPVKMLVAILVAPVSAMLLVWGYWTGALRLGLEQSWQNAQLRRKHHMRRAEVALGFRYLGAGLAFLAGQVMVFVWLPITILDGDGPPSALFNGAMIASIGPLISAVLMLFVGHLVMNDYVRDRAIVAMDKELISPRLF